MNKRGGFTLIEVMIGLTVLSVMSLVIIKFFTSFVKVTTKLTTGISSYEKVTNAMRTVESKLYLMNEITSANSSNLVYIADMNTDPNYNKYADFDGDGVPDYLDPDVDGDAITYAPAAGQQWKVGYNLTDDDDDNDGNIDMKWRFYATGSSLNLDYSKNQEAWGHHVKKVLDNIDVSTPIFTYYGSRDPFVSIGGAVIDQEGNNDGIVTAYEIDKSSTAGNNNGKIDTALELSYITALKVHIAAKVGGDKTTEYSLDTKLMPPLLSAKRIR